MFNKFKKARNPEDEAEGYRYSLWLLGKRWWGEAELSRRLKTKGFVSDVVAKVVTRLKAEKFLDDKRLLENLIKNLTEAGNHGPIIVKQKLLAKGFKEGVDKYLKKYYTQEKQVENIKKLAKKSGLAFSKDKTAKAKLYQRISRRGFNSSVIIKSLNMTGEDFE